MTQTRVRVALVCDNCGKRFTLMPADARARMKNKHMSSIVLRAVLNGSAIRG